MRNFIVLILFSSFTISSSAQQGSASINASNADTAADSVRSITDVENEDIYILSDFEVSASDDQGYFSANSNSATRTNSLVKNTPITMSIVNEELLSDLGIQSNEDLAAVVSGIDTDPDGYSLDRLRIRGFRVAASRYDYFPRSVPRDGYNVNRVDIIKGANSLIFGQASPGGTVNTIPQLANFAKDVQAFSYTVGDKGFKRGQLNVNQIVNDQLAIKFMGVNLSQEYDHPYKKNRFKGGTLAVNYKPSAKTNFRLHLESVDTETYFPVRAMKDRTLRDDETLFDSDGRNDDYNGMLSRFGYEVPYTPDFVEFLPAVVVEHIVQSSSTINDKSDITALYDGINAENYGSIAGPDKMNDRDGYFASAKLQQLINDDLEFELAINQQEVEGNGLSRDSYGAPTVRQSFTLPYQNIDPKTAFDVGEPYISTYWTKNNWQTKRQGLKATVIYDGEFPFSVGVHKLVGGFDYDSSVKDAREFDMIPIGALLDDGSYAGQDLLNNNRFTDRNRAYEYFGIDTGFDSTVPGILFDFETSSNISMLPLDGTTDLTMPNGSLNSPDYTLPSYDLSPDSEWALRQTQYSDVETYSQWFALQSEFMDGRIHTLLGARYDNVNLTSRLRKVIIHGLDTGIDDGNNNLEDDTYHKLSPSLGALYWLNSSVGIFANYAESIESPAGTQRTPIGEIAPPEYGRGLEGGIRFSTNDNKIDGQFVYYQIEKENDDEFPYTTNMLNAIYPFSVYGEQYPELYYNGGSRYIRQGLMAGRRAPGDKTISEGLELDLTYNPSKAWTFFGSYNYTIDNSVTGLDPSITPSLQSQFFYQGDQLPGRPKQRANFTARYKFTSGKLRNLSVGVNQTWRSPSMVTFFILPDGSNHPLRLGHEFSTNLFMNYSFKLKGSGKLPKVSLGLNIYNILDNRDLINRGNYAFYREGRSVRFMTKIAF